MKEFMQIGLEVVNKIVSSGGEAFLGGKVLTCDYLNSAPSAIDILTSLPPESIKGLIQDSKAELINDHEVILLYHGYKLLVSSFRSNSQVKNKDGKTMLTLNYKEAITHLSFTIDAILMKYDEVIVDEYLGCDDLKNKKIRLIGKITRLSKEPEIILDTLSRVSETNFHLTSKLLKGMKKYKKYLKNIETSVLYDYVIRILNGKYYQKAIKIIDKMNAFRYFRNTSKTLKDYKKYKRRVKDFGIDEFIMTSLVRNKIQEDKLVSFSSNEVLVRNVYNLSLASPKSKYDVILLYSYGLEAALLSNKINYLLGKTKLKQKKIKQEYNKLAIKKVCDLKFKGEDILALTGYKSSKFIEELVDELAFKVLKNELINEHQTLKDYAVKRLSEEALLVDANAVKDENKLKEVFSIKEEKEESEKIELNKGDYQAPIQSLIKNAVFDLVREAASQMPKNISNENIYKDTNEVKMIEAEVMPSRQEENSIINDSIVESSINNEEVNEIVKVEEENTIEEMPQVITPLMDDVINKKEEMPFSRVEVDIDKINNLEAYKKRNTSPLKAVSRSNDDSLQGLSVNKEENVIKSFTEKEQIARDYSNLKLNQLERDMWQQEQKLKEKENELKKYKLKELKREFDEKVNKLVEKNMTLLDNDEISDVEKNEMRQNFIKTYQDYVLRSDERFKDLKGEI